ncbi:MAG TPA: [protein-PII] uridylyltransferase [Thiolapillus brandeum]|uniref:Bifunctional uridylyltransferase/uridylyl-removing enzyme n=1 Tax=Thiolapillus brandeum TaxID=1076588 RepID=A0A831RV61_9GAMM|nr:[protein-PII] uridylyltransferase [Thiolapillus brandeum]
MPISLIPDLDQQLSQATDPLAAFRDIIVRSKTVLADRFNAGEAVEDLVHARSDFVDQILQRAWQHFIATDNDGALVAVGGYGRGELHPASDVDVLILVGAVPAGKQAEDIEQLITFLWDIGLEVGHSVRTLEQCVESAVADVTIVTNLMESRFLAGSEMLFQQMKVTTGPDRIWPSDEFFSAKCEEQKARHARFGDTAYNLEPNIKSNPGGLRDIQMIGWVVKRHFNAERLSELLHQGFLTDAEYQALKAGQSHLWKIRFALHLLTGRHDDRLLFEYQRSIARQFGYCDADSNLAVEQFMQDYYRTVMELNRLNEMLLQLFQEAILYQNRPCDVVRINNRFQSCNGYLEASNAAIFVRYPIAILELFLILQEHPELEGVRASTIRLIRAHLHLIDERYRKDIRSRSLFLEILRQPQGIFHTLQRMHRYGVLAAYIPAFANITGRMQFDLFHVYTVDEHTLMLLRNLRRFSVPEFEDEFPLCSRVFKQLIKPELLYIAGLFHDIAKGRGGDHAILGAEDALAFCKLHDLSDYDAEVVAWIVRSHLLMSVTAQRQDIEDPLVVQNFAQQVGDRSRLDYLYLLTVADIRATNPKRWTSWKSSLLNRLYHSTRQTLIRGLESPLGQDELIQSKQGEARRMLNEKGFGDEDINRFWRELSLEYFLQNDPEEIAWHGNLYLSGKDFSKPMVALRTSVSRGCNEIFIVQKDQKNLFARCTALIDQLHLNTLEARIQTTDSGTALNSFFVLEVDGHHIAPERNREIQEILEYGLQESTGTTPKARALPRRLQEFSSKSEITISQDVQNHHTLLRIKSMDRPGLLSLIAWVLTEQNLRLLNAKITTLGAMADDVFTLTDSDGRTLSDQARLEKLTQALLETLDQPS